MHLSPQPPLSIGIPQAHLLGLKTLPTDKLLPSSAQEEEREENREEEEDEERCCWASYGRRSGMKRLPPPITVVAKAGDKKCLMAWVLQRSYEDGGRLVMREVEVKHQEYLKAYRKKGRLILTVVHVEPPPENPSWPSILSSMVAISSSTGPLFKALPAVTMDPSEKESDGLMVERREEEWVSRSDEQRNASTRPVQLTDSMIGRQVVAGCRKLASGLEACNSRTC